MSTRLRKPYLELTPVLVAQHPALLELARLHQAYTALLDALKPLKAQEATLREQLGAIVAEVGTVEIPGQVRFEITPSTMEANYDVAGLDQLVEMLREDGYPEIAEAILEHRAETMRAGRFRMTPLTPLAEDVDA